MKKKQYLKKGNLESFLSDNQKLYFKKRAKLSLVPLKKITEKNNPKLFYFLYNNWEKILDIYFWGNHGNQRKMKPVKFIISEKNFHLVTENIKGKFDTIIIAFSSVQELLILTYKQPKK